MNQSIFSELPEKWDGWTIVNKIGEGSSGSVYEAVRGTLHRAVKIICLPRDEADRAALMIETKDTASAALSLAEMAGTISRSIETQQSLKDNEHIVGIEDYVIQKSDDGLDYRIYILMELLTPLTDCFDEEPVTEERIVKIGEDICDALSVLEDNKIIHRDIKPGNIFIDTSGNFKLGDFGSAGRIDRSSENPAIRGTYSYMAPEIFSQKKHDHRADIYSLGIVLYRLMNRGRDPFVDPEKQLVGYRERENALIRRMQGEELPAPVDASEKLARAILNATAHDPVYRYKDAAQMKADLQKVLEPDAKVELIKMKPESGGGNQSGIKEQGAKKVGSYEDGQRLKQRQRLRAACFAGALLVAAAAGLLLYNARNSGRTGESSVQSEVAGTVFEGMPALEDGHIAAREKEKIWSEDMEEALVQADVLLTHLSGSGLSKASDFRECFTGADDAMIEDYFYDLRYFNDYPAREVLPVAELSGVYLVNVIGYHDRDYASDETDASRAKGSEAAWSQGWLLPMTKSDGSWKISLEPGILDELMQQLLEEGAYPKGYIPYIDTGFMIDYNNYMHIDADRSYRDVLAAQARFIWKDDHNDLFIGIQFSNGTDSECTFKNISLQLVDINTGGASIVLNGTLPGEVAVNAGTNDFQTWKFPGDALLTDYASWNDIRPVINCDVE